MPDTIPEPPLAALLRRAGHDLPPDVLADLEHGHTLLRGMLARLADVAPGAEPATTFRPDAQR